MQIIRLADEAYDEDILEDFGVTFVIYYYENEGYEGLGKCLAYKEGKWYTNDLGHCSCYGPFDNFPENTFDNIEDAIVDLHDMDWSKYFIHIIEKMALKASVNVH